MKIIVKSNNIEIKAELKDNDTANNIYKNLPIKATAKKWGDEIYFEVPFHIDLDSSAKEVVEIGDIGFWPSGNCFCIFFGKTPASAVNVFGKIKGNIESLHNIRDSDQIIVQKQ